MLKDVEKTKAELVEWIRQYFAENGPQCSAVIGISGGKDSSVTAALLVEALGKDRVVGVLMPNGEQADISDSRLLVETLDIPHAEINIAAGFEGMKQALETSEELKAISGQDGMTKDARINLAPRLRMATLYAVAQMLPNGGRVANTCNASEDYVGYSTKYGDAAGDFSPLQQMCVEEVRQLGLSLGLPEELVQKKPSDGLSGMGDEEKLGFTYAVLDRYIRTGEIDDQDTKARIDRLHRLNLHKLRLMPAYQLADEDVTGAEK